MKLRRSAKSVELSPIVCCIVSEPRLSAAITTPSLNLTATTEVPVTMGDCVWFFGTLECRYDGL